MTLVEESIVTALCIASYANRDPEWANWHSRRVRWAEDIVRQIAERPMPAIDGDLCND